jgi:hypothetical protein
MVELIALAVANVTHRLWATFTGRGVAVLLWVTYGATIPEAVMWAEHTFPEEVNMVLPFLGVTAATGQAVRHYRHKHNHAQHVEHPVTPAA